MTPIDQEAQRLIARLREAGWSLLRIAATLGVSERSVYRWAVRESAPQRESDMEHLRRLVAGLDPGQAP